MPRFKKSVSGWGLYEPKVDIIIVQIIGKEGENMILSVFIGVIVLSIAFVFLAPLWVVIGLILLFILNQD